MGFKSDYEDQWTLNDIEPITLDEWADALRSGNYEQSRHYLCITDDDEYAPEKEQGYCCLGVASSEMNVPDDELTGKARPSIEFIQIFEKLPINSDQENLLMYLNDSWRFTFDEIADVLESNFSKDLILNIAHEKDVEEDIKNLKIRIENLKQRMKGNA